MPCCKKPGGLGGVCSSRYAKKQRSSWQNCLVSFQQWKRIHLQLLWNLEDCDYTAGWPLLGRDRVSSSTHEVYLLQYCHRLGSCERFIIDGRGARTGAVADLDASRDPHAMWAACASPRSGSRLIRARSADIGALMSAPGRDASTIARAADSTWQDIKICLLVERLKMSTNASLLDRETYGVCARRKH